ncbi:YggS family pyridoxal phosphate-dependent enzyme [Anaerofustis stercorihominis]|uniref:YggS family pyridoxal phosphate-dependent enzyme n=1 Tax=Anaerofustis stercorihominis TaxID=214853 RepID=UPI00214BF39F|nr:YggS family pyridoxal phosphate-dependent enzyme [Anaerofustis stercorihominis]MCR2032062.1 YggS family pyridoxal phosphate-dependent enzyme [Anaerofustis stercorihominis]
MSIKDNLDKILNNINLACNNSDFDEDVKLLAVTKFRTNEEIKEVIDYGIKDLGENKVKEFLGKYEFFKGQDINWHFIGHLQRNKVKDIVGKVHLIHSVDSIRLMEEIDKQSAKKDIITNILIEFNIGKEENKYGFDENEVEEAFNKAIQLKNVNVMGVMCMAPFTKDKAVLVNVFRKLRKIYDNCRNMYNKYDNINLAIISMGMSNDYQVAIDEGSNIVRIGTSIFEGE